jgi:hypothetical protein
MKKLKNNQCGYMLKDYFKRFFISHWKNTIFNFSCKHNVYIIMGFKSHIKKIKHSSSIYIVNFDMS